MISYLALTALASGGLASAVFLSPLERNLLLTLLASFTDIEYWQEQESADEIDALVAKTTEKLMSNGLVGEISLYINQLPGGYLAFDGVTRAEQDFPALVALFGVTLPNWSIGGGLFILPNMSGALVGLGLSGQGVVTGTNDITLDITNIPAHTHTYIQPGVDADFEDIGVPTIAGGAPFPSVTGSAGLGLPFTINPRKLVLGLAIRYA